MSDFERGHQNGECGEGAYSTGNQNYICIHGTFIVVFITYSIEFSLKISLPLPPSPSLGI